MLGLINEVMLCNEALLCNECIFMVFLHNQSEHIHLAKLRMKRKWHLLDTQSMHNAQSSAHNRYIFKAKLTKYSLTSTNQSCGK